DKGIATEGFFVIGFITATVETIRATIDYAIDLSPTFALFIMLTPFPSTPLFKHMKSLITEVNWAKFDGYTSTFQHPNLTHEDLVHLLGLADTRFYVRPSFGLNYLGIKTPIETLDALKYLEAYTNRRQVEENLACLKAQAQMVID